MDSEPSFPSGPNGRGSEASSITLRDFRLCKNGPAVVYSLQLTDGSECWVVARRYSEFLRCHAQLLEVFSRRQLPPFPPKEPFLQKIFGRGEARSDWVHERYARLHGYILGLMEHPGASKAEVFLDFLGAPKSSRPGPPAPEKGLLRCPQDEASQGPLISGVRVRLTGEVGGVEVVVRADSHGPFNVRLALRPLPEDGSDWQDEKLSLESLGPWERLMELEMHRSGEVTQRFSLEPGSLWQVAAVGVGPDAIAGNAVCIQLRSPTESELAGIPQAVRGLSYTEETQAPGEKVSFPKSARGLSHSDEVSIPTPARGLSYSEEARERASNIPIPELDEEALLEEPLQEQEEPRGAAVGGFASPSASPSSPSFPSFPSSPSLPLPPLPQSPKPDDSEVDVNSDSDHRSSARSSEKLKGGPVSPGSRPRRHSDLSPRASASGRRSASCQSPGKQVAGFPDGGHESAHPPEQVDPGLVRDPRESGLSPGESPVSRALKVFGSDARARSHSSSRLRAPVSADKVEVFSFQGSAAVEYALRIEESQRQAVERAPHRWEARPGLGQGRSVARATLSVRLGAFGLGASEAQAFDAPKRRGPVDSVEELDGSIQAHQRRQLKEDECRVAAWLHAVTGDSSASASAASSAAGGGDSPPLALAFAFGGSFEAALQSGEVLCDLVNAIWPGRIVCIARGEVAKKHFRRIDNITHFVQACGEVGVDASSRFVPSDLAEGKNFRSVLRCLCALAGQVPEPPGYEGPRLGPRSERPSKAEIEFREAVA